MKRTYFPVLTALAAFGLAPLTAHAQTVITGHHDNNPAPPGNGDGYDISNSTFVVLANTGTALDATFSHNTGCGLFFTGSTAIIDGGTFSNNGQCGVGCYTNSNATITGGVFNGNARDFFAVYGNVDLYGAFLDPVTQKPLAPGQTVAFGLFAASSFTGTLEDNTVSQTYTFADYNGVVTLHDVAPAPEPSQWVALLVGALGLGALALRARKRSAA